VSLFLAVINHRKCFRSAVIFQRSNFQMLQLILVLAFFWWVGYSSVIKSCCASATNKHLNRDKKQLAVFVPQHFSQQFFAH